MCDRRDKIIEWVIELLVGLRHVFIILVLKDTNLRNNNLSLDSQVYDCNKDLHGSMLS